MITLSDLLRSRDGLSFEVSAIPCGPRDSLLKLYLRIRGSYGSGVSYRVINHSVEVNLEELGESLYELADLLCAPLRPPRVQLQVEKDPEPSPDDPSPGCLERLVQSMRESEQETWSADEIITLTGFSRKAAQLALSRLSRAGKIKRVSRGRYKLCESVQSEEATGRSSERSPSAQDQPMAPPSAP